MRQLCLLFLFLVSSDAYTQTSRIDFARLDETPDRRQITEAFRLYVQKEFATDPVFLLDHLYIKKEFAFLVGKIRDSEGKEIDFARFDAGDRKSALPFRGQETRALLKRQGESWKVLTWLVTPDDVACACWWAEYSAPKDLFDYTDYCR
ncbi:hypothetical protein HRG84_12390 [Flavisolibacter sp. BT320]|nr:hypothetical protein [Flavisolibacter longurius]